MKRKDAYELLMGGRQMLAARHNHQAVVMLEGARDLEPEKGSVREALGRALYNIGETERACEEFQTAIELNPADDYAYFGLALCRARLGDRRRAAGLLKIALAMRPNSKDYRRALDRLAC
ncbi:MAG: tetratricopeptide repeat protein [Actinomycetota bacterium]